MKFLVLLCTTFIVQCMAVKSSDAESYSAGVAYASGWAGCIKRFYILILLIPGVVLYYIPESRYYARKACHVIIDVVANGLKAALSGSFVNQPCVDAGRSSYHSEGFRNASEIQDSIVVANAQRDHLNPSHLRRRHRVKQDSKTDEDKAKGNDKRRHRHKERSRNGRDEKNRSVQHRQSMPKTTSKDSSHLRPGTITEGFYYPETPNDHGGPKYSTSFVMSGVKTSPNFSATDPYPEEGNAAILGEEEHRRMDSKQRSRPSRRTRLEDAIFPENEGPTRDCGSFILTDLECERSYDIDSKIEFSTETLDYPERECDVLSHTDYPRHEDSATTVQEREDVAEDWERGGDERDSDQNEDRESYLKSTALDASSEIAMGFPAAEESRSYPVRRVNFQKKEKERERRKSAEDEDNRAAVTNSEKVLGQLGDQIAELEKTIRMMKPEMSRKERGHRSREAYAVQNIETVLMDMKRSFSKVDEQMKNRQRRNPSGEKATERSKPSGQSRENGQTILQEDTESSTSFFDEYASKGMSSSSSFQQRQEQTGNEVPEEDSSTSRRDLTIFRSETLLEDEEEMGPIVTNRVKPYLIRTFDWLFTGCPGVSAANKYIVGKDGASETAAE